MNLAIVVLSGFLLLVVGYFVWGIWAIIRSLPQFRMAWQRTDETARFAFNLGWLIFLAIPLFKQHPASNNYLALVGVELLPAVAGGLFVAGLLALMQQLRLVGRELEAQESSESAGNQ